MKTSPAPLSLLKINSMHKPCGLFLINELNENESGKNLTKKALRIVTSLTTLRQLLPSYLARLILRFHPSFPDMQRKYLLSIPAAVLCFSALCLTLGAHTAIASESGGQKIERVAQKTGNGIRKGVEKTGAAIKKGADKAGKGIKKGAEHAGRGIKKGVEKTGEALEKAGKKIQQAAGKLKQGNDAHGMDRQA